MITFAPQACRPLSESNLLPDANMDHIDVTTGSLDSDVAFPAKSLDSSMDFPPLSSDLVAHIVGKLASADNI